MIYGRVLFVAAMVLGTAFRLEAATATWDRNPEPNVAGYVLSYGTSSGVHPTSIDVGNVITFQFFPPAGWRYYIVVQAYYNSSALSPKSAEVTLDLTSPNQPPTLAQPANQTTARNSAASLALIASDPNGTAVTFSATGLPPGLSLNASTGVIAGTVTTAGIYSVTATASDGRLAASRTFTWTVSAQNQPPVLSQPANQSSPQNTDLSVTLAANDPDGTSVTFSAAGLPSGLSVNASTGVIAGTVTTVGTYTVTATASDGSLTASRTFTWTVTGGAGAMVVALSPADTTLNLDSTNRSTSQRLTTYTYPANRVANVILMRFDVSQIPANATIQSATLQLALVESDSVTTDPNYSVSLHQVLSRNPEISRATGMTANGVIAWTANTCCLNGVPMAQADISPARSVTAVGRNLGFKTWDALLLVRAWRQSPTTNRGLVLNADATKGPDRYRSFASVEYPTVTQRPVLRITYTLASTGGDSTPPTVALSAPASNATVSGSNVTVLASASDAAGVAGVQFRLDGANLGAEDTAAPFSINWNTTTVVNGSHVLTAVARDAAGNTGTAAPRTVTVSNTVRNTAANRAPTSTQVGDETAAEVFTSTANNTNRPPVLMQPASQVSMAGDSVTLALSASDPDGTAATYQATGLPPALTVSATTGVIAGTLSADSAGVYSVTATVSDGSFTDSRNFTWSVDNSDTAVQGDFDGDGRADPATYRPSSGEWHLRPSGNNFVAAAPIVWGGGSDIPIPADYDGDRKTDIAVYRPSSGIWHVLLSSTSMQTTLDIQWGNSTDQPLPVDYDGDGRADLALPRFGGFEILLSRSNYLTSVIVQ